MKCDLCNAVKSGHYANVGSFIYIPKCRTCGDPMLVSKYHKPKLDEFEQKEFDIYMTESGNYRPRGIGMQSHKQHYHEHLLDR